MTPHTPTPWEVKDHSYIFANKKLVGRIQGFTLSDETNEANAAYIVKAVNAHEGLVKAAKNALETLKSVQADTEDDNMPMPWPEIDELEQALAALEQGEG